MNNDDKKSFFESLASFFSTKTPKFFKTNGLPANETTEDRNNLIHINEVETAFNNLVEKNSDNGDKVAAIEKINDPKAVTNYAKGELTPTQRAWLIGYIFSIEGGYFNHPNDPGGETMYGITKRMAIRCGYKGSMRQLPKEVATEIYIKKYWKAYKLDQIKDFKIALCIFDFIVNGGNRGIKAAQRTINKIVSNRSIMKPVQNKYKDLKPVVVDGIVGPATIESINKIDVRDFLSIYFYIQEDTYEDIMRANSKLRSFDEGWENRIARKILFLNELENYGA